MAIQISGSTVIHDSQDVQVSGVVTATSFHGDASQLTNLPAEGSSLEATASGTLADGSKVIVNTDGTVSVVTQTETLGPGSGTAEVFASVSTNAARSATYDSANNKVVIAYQDGAASDHGKAVVGTVNTSTNEITFGSPVTFASNGKTDKIAATFDSTNSRVVIAYEDAGNSSYGTAVVGQVSGTSISFGTPVVYEFATTTGGDVDTAITFDSTNGKVVIAYRDAGNSNYGTAIVGEVNPSTNAITFGSPTVFYQGNAQFISATFDSSNGRVVIAYSNRQSGQAYQGEAIVGTVSGTGINFPNSAFEFNSARSDYITATFDASKSRVVIAYISMASSPSGYGTAVVGEVDPSNNSISFGSQVNFNTAGSTPFSSAVYDASNNNVVISYYDNGNNTYGTAIIGTVDPSNNSISFGSSVVFESAPSYWTSSTYTTDGKIVIAYMDGGNNNYGTAIVFGQTGFSAVPQIGTSVDWETVDHTYFSSAVYDSTNNKVIAAYWATKGSQYGYGTAAVGTVSGTSISFGTPVTFNSDYTRDIRLAYDSTNDRVVIAFKNSSNYYGTAVVGQVSGTNISFGTPVTFASERTNKPIPVYDSTNNKVVIVWEAEWSSSHARAIVGEISGNNISFPSSSVTFNSSASYYIGATFDSTNGKVVVAFQNYGASGHGSAIVLEVSGTTINYGSPVKFVTSLVDMPHELVHDPVNNKVVILYRNSGDGTYYGTAVVGTVSGTSISFNGSATVFNSTQVGFYSLAYDSNNGKVVIIYKDGSTSSGTAIAGTVSGNNISFGTPFEIESGGISYVSVVYDSSNDKAVAVYNDEGNQYRVTATAFTPFTISSNLTAENFIGISDGAYSNGQTATIQLIGSVDDAQSGLTPGQKYYVQGDGTLSTTADSPSVLAGKAISSTNLVIKG